MFQITKIFCEIILTKNFVKLISRKKGMYWNQPWAYCVLFFCSPERSLVALLLWLVVLPCVYVRCRWWKKELDCLLSWLVGNIIIIIHHFHWNWAALILSDQLDYLASFKSGFTFSAGARILVLLVYSRKKGLLR